MGSTPESTEATSANITTSGNNGGGIKDSSHPYFLYPSDSLGMNLVNTSFDGRSFGGWRRSILIDLSAKNKVGFIDGTFLEPSSETPDFRLWSRCNDMAISWLLNSLSREIADSVICSQTTKDLWDNLEDRFGQPNSAKMYHLQKELSDLIQGSSDVACYFTKIKRLWDELDTLNTHVKCSCDCNCGGKVKMAKSLQDEKLIKFLMGLNDTYASVKSSILMLSPLPTVGHAYSLLMQDEKQREVYVNSQFPRDSSSFMAANQNHTGQKFENFVFKGKKNNLVCSYYKKPRHSVDKCYMIIGFPADFKFTKPRKFHGSVKSNAAYSVSGTEEQNAIEE
ncbi:uncharacterized protein LOC142169833 [Nicotiana tabacum]|uniref:Uncharacterized protein LOC142169833 n=1 Tax=Nicotiana tabacum TaxID=4097 RepID=A0AC58SSC2_TOBAC